MVSPFIEYMSRNEIDVPFEIVPGVTSGLSASSLLGAPLANDFAVISLSDYLIPWNKIVTRLERLLTTDLTLVIYNPVKRGAYEKIRTLREIISVTRGRDTLIGIVTKSEREGEEKSVIPVCKLSEDSLSMQSILFVAGRNIVYANGYFFNPRGYKF